MNKKKQNILISIISIIGVSIILLMFYFSNKNKIVGNDDQSYKISFKVYYIEEQLVIDDILTFNENETLLSLMERTYEIMRFINFRAKHKLDSIVPHHHIENLASGRRFIFR